MEHTTGQDKPITIGSIVSDLNQFQESFDFITLDEMRSRLKNIISDLDSLKYNYFNNKVFECEKQCSDGYCEEYGCVNKKKNTDESNLKFNPNVSDFDFHLTKTILEMTRDNALKFHSLNKYISKEFEEGKREFRIVLGDNGDAYIHPLNKDGQTLDIKFNI